MVSSAEINRGMEKRLVNGENENEACNHNEQNNRNQAYNIKGNENRALKRMYL